MGNPMGTTIHPQMAAAAEHIERLEAENGRLRDERDEWRQAAKAEANLRREFLERAEQAEAELEQTNEAHGVLVEECGRLRAELGKLQDLLNWMADNEPGAIKRATTQQLT